jgi:hypothetical protein
MVGNDVEYLPQVTRAETKREPFVSLWAAEFVVDAMGIYNIVAMLAAGSRLQVRRAVYMRDA